MTEQTPVPAAEEDNGQRLKRDWMNFQLASAMQQLMYEHLKDTQNAAGVSFATLSLCVVGQLHAMQIDPIHRSQILADVMSFMTDLMSNGWISPADPQPQPPQERRH